MNNSKVKIIAVILAVIAVSLMVVAGSMLINRSYDSGEQETRQPIRPVVNDDTLTIDGKLYEKNKRVESFLILGVDRTEEQIDNGSSAGQSDVMLLLVIDYEKNEFDIFQINRDTVTQVFVLNDEGEITDVKVEPICISHTFGSGGADSCENSVRSVSYLLGDIEIDGFIALDLRAISLLNDAVGGVTVTIDRDMTEADPKFIEGETITLTGDEAERFVRARMYIGEDTNVNRMTRQRQFMREWLKKAESLSSKEKLKLIEEIEDIAVTNMTEKRLSGIVDDCTKYKNNGFITVNGSYIYGESYVEFYPDEDELQSIILKLFYKEK